MTAIDQAFIRAYTQQDPAVSVRFLAFSFRHTLDTSRREGICAKNKRCMVKGSVYSSKA